mmetsp:Transcript_62074/g.144421  ORF Transcript_62074/g.144421 Transcript_62074/m.144421 type:complete len:566 (-) Transcript_62074:195-1892(-)
MGQCRMGCLTGVCAVWEQTRSSPQRARRVGRERRYTRQMQEEARLERCGQSCKDGRWQGDIRKGTLVSPRTVPFTAEYKLTNKSVGKGMNGFVMLASARQDPEGLVAVKMLDKKGVSAPQLLNLRREVDIYLRMDHEHIVQLRRVFDERDRIYLVMEYCSGGSLAERLQRNGRFSARAAAEAIRQVLSAVNYCHTRPSGAVCHRDLKLANFVYAADGELLKLVDFGLSRVLARGGPRLQQCAGTLEFMAPEVLLRKGHNESCDMWSVGVMTYCLICGHPPFQGGSEAEIMEAIRNGKLDLHGDVWMGISVAAKDFVMQLMNMCPNSRPDATTALRHSWLAGRARRKVQMSLSEEVEVLESVAEFAYESPANRAATALVFFADGAATGEEVERVEAQFRRLDADGNGTLSPEELTGPLQSRLGVSQEEGQLIFEGIDIVKDCEIERSEFMAAAMGRTLSQRESSIRKAFDRLDLDRNGTISPAELTAVLGLRFCGAPASQIFKEWDSSGAEAISYDQFKAVLRRKRNSCKRRRARSVTSPNLAALNHNSEVAHALSDPLGDYRADG